MHDAHAGAALIFLDINMPQMNGFDFLDAYQQLPLAQRQVIVVVMLTTSVPPTTCSGCKLCPWPAS